MLPLLPPRYESSVRVSASACVSASSPLLLSLKGLFFCDELYGRETRERVDLDDLTLFVCDAGVSGRTEGLERGDGDPDGCLWERGKSIAPVRGFVVACR